jgi:hypothetical protein
LAYKIAFAHEQNKLKEVDQTAKRLFKKCALLSIEAGAEKSLAEANKGNS